MADIALLLDEDVRVKLGEILRQRGYDVIHVLEADRGGKTVSSSRRLYPEPLTGAIPYGQRRDARKKTLGHLLKAVPHLVQLPNTHMWLDYDEKADALYVHFEDKPASTHSEIRDDGVILDYKGRRLVGVTILDASQR